MKSNVRRLLGGTCAVVVVAACSANETASEKVGAASSSVVSTNLSAYVVGQTVTVNVTANSGADTDWVAIASPNDAPNVFTAWKYLRGQSSVQFTGLRAGTYVARQYNNWAGTSSFAIAQQSNTFTVNPAVVNPVLTPQASIAAGAAFSVAFSGMPGFDQDWIAVAPAGSASSVVTAFRYTNGATSGSVSFAGLPAGNYEVRAYYDWKNTSSYQVRAAAALTIGTSTGTASLTLPGGFTPSTPISIAFNGFPGHATDWVAIANANSPPNSFIAFKYTNGASSGTLSFNGLPAGNYVARGYFDWAGTQSYSIATSTAFGNSGGVNLGMAGDYVILSKAGISTVPPSAVTGNLGVSPAPASYITGFSLTADATNVFSTSPQVTGRVYASDYAAPTPSNLTTAVGDMMTAFTDAAGRAPGVTELGAGNIGGMTLTPGVYKWGTGVLIPTSITLNGSAADVWIFQIAQGLTVSSATNVTLAGGAISRNVFWQVSGAVDLGTTSHFEGVVLSQTSITLRTGASINGRLLAQTAVSIDSSTVVAP